VTAEPTDIVEALARLRARIEDACRRARRDPTDVRLVAVSKTVSPERIRELIRAGHRIVGENRIQEVEAKREVVGPEAVWHFIGHLQRNKVRQAVGAFELIHSVDSLRLARELNRRALALDVRQAVLLQVNQGGESTKHGLAEDQLLADLEGLAELERLELRGLMTIPPPTPGAADSARWFAALRRLRDTAASRTGLALEELSMGMTADFETAIEEGATLIRVGTALFGARPD
jgi:pyridoxal phosphate enzyme (YggS family)